MKSRYHYTIIFFCATVLFWGSGCAKFLDEKQNFTYSDGSSLKDVQAILDDAEYMNRRSPTLPEAAADDFFLPVSNFNSLNQISREMYSWTLRDYTFPNDWANLFFQVFNANICLEKLEALKKEGTTENAWNGLYGSSLFFRANANYWLVTTFAKGYDANSADRSAGIPVRTTSDFNVLSARSNLEESYKHIESDLINSIPFLPERVEVPLRPSKAAAFGLLARVHLAKREYKKAAIYADSALMINNDILDFNAADLNLSANLPFSNKYNKEVVFYSSIGIYTISTAHPLYARVDSTLYQSFDDNDLRKTAYFLQLNDGYRFKGMYSDNANLCFTGITNAELLLISAEGKIREGELAHGMRLMDKLLINRFKTNTYQSPSDLSQPNALKFVLDERRRELLMRGLRFSDLKRLNLEGAGIAVKRRLNDSEFVLPPNDPKFALPIPLDVVQLGQIEQNPY